MAEESRTPTAWELLRAVEGVGKTVEAVRTTMLTRDQFDEYQRGTDLRFTSQEKRQAEWEAKSERAHGELDGKIKAVEAAAAAKIEAVEAAADQREKESRDARGRVWLAIATTVLVVVAPRVWEILRGTGAAP